MPTISRVLLVAAAVLAAGCGDMPTPQPVTVPATPQQNPQPYVSMTPLPASQSTLKETVNVITLRSRNGLEMKVLSWGGIIQSLRTPDRTGEFDDIVLGFDAVDDYGKSPYFGCLIGRYCNRIAKGAFSLDGKKYSLAINNAPNSLHGGNVGWDKKNWTAEPFQDANGVGVVLTLTSADGDEGYPGTVKTDVKYTLNDKNQLIVDYHATTDKATVINLTQHAYFNLAGGKAADILGHQLMLNAAQYTPVDETLIPTGKIESVEGTPLDFRTPTAIGARINDKHEQLIRAKGYDHNWVVQRSAPGLVEAARVLEPTTGRTLAVATTEPGIQFYSGNFLDGTLKGKGARTYTHRSGFCLETQHYPDSPNHANFPTTVLRPGEEYRSQTIFTFGVAK